ncbi:hypothetical protein GP486_007814 [Trichoglossum hirsutum]|uniref:Uncharacterized protein n=1 Tax=Trichoglossum hirsutum TaxID=265104 RepID=A0A9P8IEU4_9PEZI|nr:hypothetical protein GP486_007814 [Trichoglossum hirsutum]
MGAELEGGEGEGEGQGDRREEGEKGEASVPVRGPGGGRVGEGEKGVAREGGEGGEGAAEAGREADVEGDGFLEDGGQRRIRHGVLRHHGAALAQEAHHGAPGEVGPQHAHGGRSAGVRGQAGKAEAGEGAEEGEECQVGDGGEELGGHGLALVCVAAAAARRDVSLGLSNNRRRRLTRRRQPLVLPAAIPTAVRRLSRGRQRPSRRGGAQWCCPATSRLGDSEIGFSSAVGLCQCDAGGGVCGGGTKERSSVLAGSIDRTFSQSSTSTENMDISRPRSPEAVRSRCFTYGRGGIKANGIARESLAELRLLFRRNAARSRVRAATKPWVTAQLQLYGIPFEKSSGASELKSVLEAAVRAGKCNTPAPHIAALEESLSKEYEGRLEAHARDLEHWRESEFSALDSPTEEANFDSDRFLAKYFLDGLRGQPAPHKTKDPLVLGYVSGQSNFSSSVRSIAGLEVRFTSSDTVVGWKDCLERWLDAEFAKLGSPDGDEILLPHLPTSEANFDVDRFLAKYFLDGLNGKPARRKTPNPITLHSFSGNRDGLRAAVELIPGLHIGEAYGSHEISTIIGWDNKKVQSRVRRVKEEIKEKVRSEREQQWQQTLQPHREYVTRHRTSTRPLCLSDITGSYIVRCDKLAEEYTPDAEMTLDIVKPDNPLGTKAAFFFGAAQGTMLLATSEGSLQVFRQQVEAEDRDQDSDDSSMGDHDDSPPTKGKAKETRAPPSGSIKRGTTRTTTTTTPKANRIHLQSAGRETGEDEIQLDPDNKHTGYLDFDKSKLSAKGVFSFSMFGEDIPFSIFKIADEPSNEPEPWSCFSENQYDYESKARWGGWSRF